MKAKKITIAPGLCDGCGKCVEACKQAVSKGHKKGRKKNARIKILKNDLFHFPVVCRHCEDAPCVTACMPGCRQENEEGWVVTDYKRCVGCWMCIMNCPFGAIDRDEEEHIALKCEGCFDKEIAPCVTACGMGILRQIEIKDMTTFLRKKAAARFLTGIKEDNEKK